MSEFLSDRSHSQIPLFPPPFLCLPRRSSNWRKRKSVAGAKFDNIKCSLQGAEEGWLGDFHAAEVVCSPRSPLLDVGSSDNQVGEEEEDGELRGGNLEREKGGGGNERTREEEEERELSQFRVSISLWQRKKRMQQQGASLLKFKAKNGISRRPLAHFIRQGRMFGSLDFPFCEKKRAPNPIGWVGEIPFTFDPKFAVRIGGEAGGSKRGMEKPLYFERLFFVAAFLLLVLGIEVPACSAQKSIAPPPSPFYAR